MLTSLTRLTTAVVPWLVIAGLLYVGLFVKPKPVGKTVTPAAIEARDRFYGLASPSPQVLWVVGADGKIIRSDNAGQSWQVQPTPLSTHFQDIAAWDNKRALVVGNQGEILRTEDGGESWNPADAPKNDVVNKLIDVKVYPGGEAWAVGSFGTILKSNDFGMTWQYAREPEDFILNEFVRVDANSLLAVGEFGIVLHSADNGENWNEVKTPVENSLMAVDFRDERHGLAGGLEGVLIATNDGGRTWFAVTEGLDFPPAVTEPGTARSDSWADMTTEHIFAVRWIEAMNQWVGTGAKGMWLTGSDDLQQWQSGRLAEREMAWHTAIVPFLDRVMFAGKNLGHWAPDSWQVFHDR